MHGERDLPDFTGPGAEEEIYGFSTHFDHDSFRLPGNSWETGNMFKGLTLPALDMDAGEFHDMAWQFGHPSRLRISREPHERVLGEIFYSDAIRRLQAVEQLTLPPQYTTIPNTGAFSRFEHIWGSALFVRQMAEKHGIDEEEAVRLQLRTIVSDMAHTFGSHLGDWMFQGVGGPENQHDIELTAYLEAVGVNEMLRRNGFVPESVIFPDINDWIEADQPDLCVDRVDYGLREMNRWNEVVRSQAFTADDFTLTPDNMLAMTNQKRARIFAEGFLLLSQEHWSEPTHRLMLDLLMMRTKLFYAEGRAPGTWVFEDQGLLDLQKVHPRDLMYVTDPAQMEAYAKPNLSGHILESMMKSIAQYRRQYVWPGRQERIYRYMSQFADEDSYAKVHVEGRYEPLESDAFDSYLDDYPKTLPNGLAFLDSQTAEATRNDFCIDLPQPPFKQRQIDPLVETHGGFRRLSEIEPTYKRRMTEHKEIMAQSKIARLTIADPDTLKTVRAIVDNVETHWQQRLQSSRRMSSDELRSLVSVSANSIHGAYPFMGFMESYQY